MRILVSGLGRDSHPTGICRVAASHAKALLSDRYASRVFLAIGSWQHECFSNLLGLYAHQIEFLVANIRNSSISRNFWYAATLPRLARAYSADIVHLSYPAPTFRKAFRRPVVVTLHDLYPYDMPENFGFPQYYANRAILRQCLSSVDGIACVSNTTQSRLEEIFPGTSRRVPTVVTGNYVEIPSEAPAPPALLQRMGPEGFVLTVGQHRKNKNLALLIRGFAELANCGGFDGPLVIVGSEGPETASLHKLSTSLGVSERVKLIHSIFDTELHWLYANCSLFVACSSIEGYCLPLAEAQANQARIVCSDIAILKEIGGTNCSYFSLAGDAVRNLVVAMKTCLNRAALETGPDLCMLKPSVLAGYTKLYSLVMASTRSEGLPTPQEPAA
jgi:glycosyltransferase involved in cell wall biosynthesis